MNTLRIFLPLLCCINFLQAQSAFNIAQPTQHPLTDVRDFLIHEDTIVTYGIGFNESTDWRQGLVLNKFDSSGNLLLSRIILHPPGDFYSIGKTWGKIIRTSDGGFAMTAAPYYSNSAVLIKTDNNFNIQFIKEYPDTINLSNYFYKLLETPQGYLLYGAIQRPDFYDDGFIRHVDKAGNTIWFKYLQFSNFGNSVLDLASITDTNFIAAIGTETNFNPNKGKVSFVKFNIDGTIKVSWSSKEEPNIGYIRKIVQASEKQVISFGVFKTGNVGNTTFFQPTLAHLDSNFQTTWVSHFGRVSSLTASVLLWKFAPTTDGNYIGAGETLVKDGNDPSRRVGWLYKFSPEGDSIWERKINVPFLPLYYTNNGYFSGVGVLSSGNIVAGGTANEGNKEYCWLVKISNDGCMDTLFCQSVSATQAPENRSALLQFSPNPAREQLRISYPAHPGGGQIRLYDMQGKLQQNIALPEGSSSYVLPVQHLPEGIYFAHWLYAGTSGVGKIVIGN